MLPMQYLIFSVAFLASALLAKRVQAVTVPEELSYKYGYEAVNYMMLIFYPVINNPPALQNNLQTIDYSYMCPSLNLYTSSCLKSVLSTDQLSTQYLVAYINTRCCQADGSWSIWSSWSTCSVSCGRGSQSRTRSCLPSGAYCPGLSAETQACNSQTCPILVNGGWSIWSSWSSCSVTCAGGSQSRSRTCTNPAPANGGASCFGSPTETLACGFSTCPIVVNGAWSSWVNVGGCSASCGGGVQSRTRFCNNPAPANGGTACVGLSADTVLCNTQNCPINGNWSIWSSWFSCSVTCGGGSQTRSRTCTNPAPAYGGAGCSGSTTETQACNTNICLTVVNGAWSSWVNVSGCSATCGGGVQSRTRSCNNPAPANGGTDCVGLSTDAVLCNTQNCPINGAWSFWNSWFSCSVTCGGGSQTRSRTCTNPAPAYGGAGCSGSTTETQACNTNICPIVVNGAWSNWVNFGSCSVSCGGGVQSRTRSCNNPAPANGGAACVGLSTDAVLCNTQNCPVNGFWSIWSSWSSCSVSCGGGSQSRSRTCTNPAPAYGGAGCYGNGTESQTCSTNNCPPYVRTCGRYNSTTISRIVGGQAANPGEYPWSCHLVYLNTVLCGCSVVDERHVITAGHCLDDKVLNNNINSQDFEVVVGQYNRSIDVLEPGAQRVKVVAGTRNPNYNGLYLLNDISLLRLATPLVYNDRVGPVCLPDPADRLPDLPDNCVVIGWGSLTYVGDVAKVLMEVAMAVYNNTECERVFQTTTRYDINIYLMPGVMCAANGLDGGKDACRGDSGSSLICEQVDSNGQYWKQMGIVSSGFGCASAGQPGYYTYLPYYVTWVKDTIAEFNRLFV